MAAGMIFIIIANFYFTALYLIFVFSPRNTFILSV